MIFQTGKSHKAIWGNTICYKAEFGARDQICETYYPEEEKGALSSLWTLGAGKGLQDSELGDWGIISLFLIHETSIMSLFTVSKALVLPL